MNDFDRRIADTVFAVEATHFEQHMLWYTHCGMREMEGTPTPGYRQVSWEQVNPGCTEVIGTLDGRPVNLCAFWNRIEGRLVMFYEVVSQVSDSVVLDAWIEKKFAGKTWDGGRPVRCDAQNFALCIHALDELNGRTARRTA
jgi:hypothetical protein